MADLEQPMQQPDNSRPPVRLIWKLAAFAGLGLAGLIFAGILGGVLLAFVVPGAGGELASYALFVLAVLVVSWACLILFDGQGLAAIGIGFDRPWLRHLVGGALAGALMVLVCWSAFLACGWATAARDPALPIQPGALFTGAGTCLCVAAAEELLCRGYPFQLLARWNLWAGLIICGLFFASQHAVNPGAWSPVAVVNLLLVHGLFAACYLRTRSLWVPIGLHAGWNFTLGFVFGLPVSGKSLAGSVWQTAVDQNLWTGREFGPEGGLVVSIVLVFAAAAAVKVIPQYRPQPDLLAPSPRPSLFPGSGERPSPRVRATPLSTP